MNFADLLYPMSLHVAEAKLNERLIAITQANANLLLLDIGLLIRRHGEQSLLSDAFWYLGRFRYSNLMFRSLATMIQQAVAAYAPRSKKVLAMACTNQRGKT